MALLLVRVSPKIPRPGTTGPVPCCYLVCKIAHCFSYSELPNRVALRVAVLFLLIHSPAGSGSSTMVGALESARCWLVAHSAAWWACLLGADCVSWASGVGGLGLGACCWGPYPVMALLIPLKLPDTPGTALLAFVLVVSEARVPLGSSTQYSPHPGYSLFSLLTTFLSFACSWKKQMNYPQEMLDSIPSLSRYLAHLGDKCISSLPTAPRIKETGSVSTLTRTPPTYSDTSDHQLSSGDLIDISSWFPYQQWPQRQRQIPVAIWLWHPCPLHLRSYISRLQAIWSWCSSLGGSGPWWWIRGRYHQ